MQIRKAEKKDIKDLVRLVREDLGYAKAQEDFVRSKFCKLDHGREEVFVADVDGVAAGFIHVEVYSNLYFGPVGNILGLAVGETFRKQGFGSQLLKAAEEWSKEKGCVGMRLNSGGSRVGAHEFYRAQGYDDEKAQLRFLKMY